MPNMLEVYKCIHCGNIVEVLHGGGSELVCCGEPMKFMKEGTSDGAKEKHVPVIEKTATGYKVKVGSVAHPMEETHWIEAEFCIQATEVTAREYCNLHGHWKA